MQEIIKDNSNYSDSNTPTWFYLNDIKYVIKYINSKQIIYREIDNKLIELSMEEIQNLNKLFEKNDPYTLNDKIIINLLNENTNLENREYLFDFVTWLDKLIPNNCKDNFYRNIRTLKTKLNLEWYEKSDGIEMLDGYSASGEYNTYRNDIVIYKESLSELMTLSKMFPDPQSFYWQEYNRILLHELCHMASSRYDYENNISYYGFSTYPANTEEEKNDGLNEGFTELISINGFPISPNLQIASGYFPETCIVNQLILIIGYEVFLESYFSNLGIDKIKEKLNELNNSKNLSYGLFRNIELNYQIRDFNIRNIVYSNIENCLIDYLQEKLDILFENNEYDMVIQKLELFEQLLLTPEKLVIMKKDPRNYIGLEGVINRFNSIKNMYMNKTIYYNTLTHS